MFFKIDLLKNSANFTGKHLCWSLFLIKFQAFRSVTPAQVFSCDICEIFKNTIFTEHLQWLLLNIRHPSQLKQYNEILVITQIVVLIQNIILYGTSNK